MTEFQDQLRLKLSDIRKDSKSSGAFYPPTGIAEVLSIDAIRNCVFTIPHLNDNPRDIQRFATLIRETCIRIFAILLVNRDEEHITEFLFRRENDSRIPYTETGLYFFRDRNILIARRFVASQQEFDPVILKKGDIPRLLRDREVLPFLEDREVGHGAFGTVYKVVLHPTCQELVATRNGEVAIARKMLPPGSSAKEGNILDLVGTLNHAHIVEYFGSYTIKNVTNLLFSYVPINLREFLNTRPFSDPDIIFDSLYGLSDALGKIHTFFFKDVTGNVEISRIGYHHDMRPENVLVQGTTFLITDFGLSELRADDRTSKTRLKGGDDDYLGPESFNAVELCNGTVGRALDVWAFGCILLEIGVFIQGESVEEFRATRKDDITYGNSTITDCAFHLNGRLRPPVEKKLLSLEESENLQLKDYAALIRTMLDPNTNTRMKIQQATPKLGLIAIDSKVEAIHRQFRDVSYDKENRKTDTHKFILLEWACFKAWQSIFDAALHLDEKQVLMATIIPCLKKLESILQNRLRMQEQDEGKENPRTSEDKEVVESISLAVESLCRTVPTKHKQVLNDAWTHLVCDVDDIEILEALASAPLPDRYREVGIDAAKAFMCRVISDSIRAGRQDRLLVEGSVKLDNPSAMQQGGAEGPSRVLGFYLSQRVMIEYKAYDHRWTNDPGKEIHRTMNALVNLLDPEQTPRQGITRRRVLDCVGYFHEQQKCRFGFVYLLKNEKEIDISKLELFSLNHVIGMTQDAEATRRPNLGDIFLLAKELASCIHALHKVGWLHKKISSHFILVFSPDEAEAHEHVASAVLAGFDDSRPEASSVTLGPRAEYEHYQHPAYKQSVAFRKPFDYYGFGVVLLELGMWTQLSAMRDMAMQENPNNVDKKQFQQTLMKDYVDQLGERMGRIYRDVVEFCLMADDLVLEDAATDFQCDDLFKANVVDLLAKCFA
ncbi:kinase-like domain-containing protein [Clohesyomyces aquaticus]|uniref:Kinase-like domain-containing protein n=1 Tax=Clohesyomyces aquaticus TaxID=1231657 RepID=A0A1Y1ZLA0_9PLEO|nr:kinase-like domain-containing protein [Clohesyomyces aquaticus]